MTQMSNIVGTTKVRVQDARLGRLLKNDIYVATYYICPNQTLSNYD